MKKISLPIYTRYIKGKPLEAWLIKKGFKPHYSNISHLILGLAIAATTGAAAYWFLHWGGWVSIGAGFVAAWVVGLLKEVYDKKIKKHFVPTYVPVFDRLDFLATGAGGTIYCIFVSLIFATYLLIN